MNRLFDRLEKALVEHKAKSISFGYDDSGKANEVSFIIKVIPPSNDPQARTLNIKLPARLDKAAEILKRQYNEGIIRDRKVLEPEQAYRVAWRNILDWTEAQLALVDIQMVQMEEVFLPYMTNAQGLTLYELMDIGGYQLPRIESTAKVGEVING